MIIFDGGMTPQRSAMLPSVQQTVGKKFLVDNEKFMNDNIVECLRKIELHAVDLSSIPASEQNIGNIQSVVSVALLEIKRCLEVIATEQEAQR